jgi:hypothetical protein
MRVVFKNVIKSESMERFILKKLLDWKNFPYRKLDDDVLNIPRFFWTATGAGIFQMV